MSYVVLGKITSHMMFMSVFFYNTPSRIVCIINIIGADMYQLFKDYQINRNTKIDVPDFVFVQRMLLREMTRIKTYYRSSNFVVDNDHLLNQLLINLNVSTTRDLESFVRVCGEATERLARAFRLIHPVVSRPTPYHGTFYNSDTKEFIILHANEFDYNKAYTQWEKLVPIKVHSHCFTDIHGAPINGDYQNSLNESGYAVISINLPMLALQHRAWKEQVRSQEEVKTQTVNFLFQYPISNMIHRHMEIATINRLINTYNNKPVANKHKSHPIATMNMNDRMDSVIMKRLHIIRTGEYKFDQLFNIFNCLYRPNWMTVLRPIDVAPVRSVKWVLELQVLKYFEFFLQVRMDANSTYNRNEITTAWRDLRNLENDTTYFQSAYPELNESIMNIKTLLESG